MASSNKKQKSLEASLWESCNKLRSGVGPHEFRDVVLPLIFLKFAGTIFETQKEKLIKEGYSKYLEMPDFYYKDHVFFLPEKARWSYLKANAKQSDIKIKIDTAISTLESSNNALKGTFSENYFSTLALENKNIGSLIDEIDKILIQHDSTTDIIGRVYEYFLNKFAIAEGKGKGEFYTPKPIVNLICELLQPYKGKIYDPACGSGGMFVQSLKFIEAHRGINSRERERERERERTSLFMAKNLNQRHSSYVNKI